eukprot:scaffold8618_cov41-Prasinocladus_malaysianus.AAC.1
MAEAGTIECPDPQCLTDDDELLNLYALIPVPMSPEMMKSRLTDASLKWGMPGATPAWNNACAAMVLGALHKQIPYPLSRSHRRTSSRCLSPRRKTRGFSPPTRATAHSTPVITILISVRGASPTTRIATSAMAGGALRPTGPTTGCHTARMASLPTDLAASQNRRNGLKSCEG